MCLDTFEDERIEWQLQAEEMRHLLERVHSSESALTHKKVEIAEMQKILSDARIAVHEERQQYMKMKREHNAMRAQEREDRRRIRELSTMNVDIENSSIMSNHKDCRPSEFNQSLFTNSAIQKSEM